MFFFRAVQCSRNGLSCWCVDENGIEVPGSKQNGYPISCKSKVFIFVHDGFFLEVF